MLCEPEKDRKMDLFETPIVKEKKAIGRTPIHTHETRLMIGRQVVNKELSYSKAALAYGLSEGAVGAAVKLYKQTELGVRTKEKKAVRQQERNETLQEYHHQTQVKQLKQEIAELYIENQLLKKALKHFRQPKRGYGSVITPESLDPSQKAAE